MKKDTQVGKFLDHIKFDSDSSCWVWEGWTIDGYGRLLRDRVRHSAHRYMWWLCYGNFIPGEEICHTCDNKLCVNPSHLESASHRKNIQDAADRGLLPSRTGTNNPNWKHGNRVGVPWRQYKVRSREGRAK